jgi:hypothetical protein
MVSGHLRAKDLVANQEEEKVAAHVKMKSPIFYPWPRSPRRKRPLMSRRSAAVLLPGAERRPFKSRRSVPQNHQKVSPKLLLSRNDFNHDDCKNVNFVCPSRNSITKIACNSQHCCMDEEWASGSFTLLMMTGLIRPRPG